VSHFNVGARSCALMTYCSALRDMTVKHDCTSNTHKQIYIYIQYLLLKKKSNFGGGEMEAKCIAMERCHALLNGVCVCGVEGVSFSKEELQAESTQILGYMNLTIQLLPLALILIHMHTHINTYAMRVAHPPTPTYNLRGSSLYETPPPRTPACIASRVKRSVAGGGGGGVVAYVLRSLICVSCRDALHTKTHHVVPFRPPSLLHSLLLYFFSAVVVLLRSHSMHTPRPDAQ
jgi:hypothetical protein